VAVDDKLKGFTENALGIDPKIYSLFTSSFCRYDSSLMVIFYSFSIKRSSLSERVSRLTREPILQNLFGNLLQ
jgi:hypothetical protein